MSDTSVEPGVSSVDDVAHVVYDHLTRQLRPRREWSEIRDSQVRGHYRAIAHQLLAKFDIRPKAAKS